MVVVGSCACGSPRCYWCSGYVPTTTLENLGWFYQTVNVTTTRPDRRSGVILATRRRTGRPGTKRYAGLLA